jgi:hypothetical protein
MERVTGNEKSNLFFSHYNLPVKDLTKATSML